MNYLLDTHIFIWLALERDRIPSKFQTILQSPDRNLFLSTASVWEMQIKVMTGKLSLPDTVEEFVLIHRYTSGIQPLAIMEVHVWELAQLPHYHKDPFDRILIAQARYEGFPLISVDKVFKQYDVSLVN